MSRKKRLFVPATLKKTKGKNGTVWHVEFSYRNPKTDEMVRKRISSPLSMAITDNERFAIALKIIDDINAKLENGWTPLDEDPAVYSDHLEFNIVAKAYGTKKKANRTIRRLTSDFLETKSSCKLKTYQTYTSKLRKFVIWAENNKLGDCDIITFNETHLKAFFTELIEKHNYDVTTVKHYKTMLWSLFNWIKKTCRLIENPVVPFEFPKKTTDFSARAILQYDLNRLLDTIEIADKQLFLACLFQYYTAIRPGTELRLLKIKDLDLHNNSVSVNSINAKNSHQQTIDLSVDLTELCINKYQLHTYNREYYVFGNLGIPGPEPMGKNTMRVRFNKFRDALSLPKYYKYYSFKHTGGKKLAAAGASIFDIKDHFRHSNIETTQRYMKKHLGERNQTIIKNFPPPRS